MRQIYLLLVVAVVSSFVVGLQSCVSDANAKVAVYDMEESDDLVWHQVNELSSLQQQKKKRVIIDVYTDWCKWCKVMDEKTFGDVHLAQYLAEQYHMVKLNAEDKSNIAFKGKSYSYIASGRKGYNELALELCQGSLSYPSLVILDEELEVLDVVKGYKDAKYLRSHLDALRQ